MTIDVQTREKIEKYMARARQAIETGQLVFAHDDYITAVNRAYYAIFNAACALLATKGLERSKHAGVIAAFREHFVKTGIIEPDFSRFYGAAMDERYSADYDLVPLESQTARKHLENATLFIDRVERILGEVTGNDTI